MALTQTQVSQLYVAIFNRASEGAGNTYWQSSTDMATCANYMLATTDAQTYFGTSLNTNQAFIEHIYLNTLNKSATDDPTGIAYWKGLLDGGMSRGEVVAALVTAVGTYASSTDPTTANAYNQFTNRVTVSNYMANTVSAAPTNYATSTSFSSGLPVTYDSTTVTSAQLKVGDLATPTYTMAAGATSVTEGSSVTFTVTSSVAQSADRTMDYQIAGVAVAGGTATPASDLGQVTGTVTILAGATTGTFTLTPTDDSTTEGFEGFNVSLLDSSFATVATSSNVVIKDGASAGQTFTLTTGVDSGTAFTGTSNNDTFNAVDPAQLQVADVLVGGNGTDTLNYTNSAAGAAMSAASITGIEIINARAVGNALTGADLSNYSGVTTFNSDRSTAAVTATNLAAGGSYGIIGNGSTTNATTSAFGYAAAATAAVLNIANGTLGTNAVTMTGAGLTSQAINSTGAANVIGAFTGAASVTSTTIDATTSLTFAGALTNLGATVTVNGAGAVNLFTTALEAGVTTLNASGNSGGLTVALGSAVTQTVTGSTGNDVITTGAVLTTGSVNAGNGTDTLVVTTGGTHLANSTLGAKYTGFETLRLNDSQDMSVIGGITSVELNAMTNKAITNMTATQAGAVKVLGDQTTGVSFALAVPGGTSDVLSITTGTGLTTGASFDLNALTVTGFETLNVTATPGPTSTVGANRTVTIGSLTGATLNTVNMMGTAFDITNAATTVAATFNAAGLTGDGTVAGSKGLTIASTTFATGSTVTGSNFIDSVTLASGTEGVTVNLGGGADAFSVNVASLVADGTNDGAFNGGDGTDTITLTDTTTTLTDNHFTKMSNMETLTLSNTVGDLSITTGSAFNSAFANGATITTGAMATATALTFNGGLSTVNTTLTVDATNMVGLTPGKDITITTGSGVDNVTVTGDDTWIGAAGDGSSIIISTGSGADTISVTIGALVVQTTSQAITITGGTGADTITKVGTNKTDVASTAHFVVASGDSGTTIATCDKITGFDVAGGVNLSDVLDFAGVGAVGTLATSTDFGTILSHSMTTGVALFDDAAAYATALVINATNLADVVGYLAANTATLDVVAFAYDSDNNGAADSTMVFSNQATDSLVQLTSVTGVSSLNATLTTATANCIAIA